MPIVRGQIDFAIGVDLQRGLPDVPSSAVPLAARGPARRDNGDAAGNAPGKPRAVFKRGGKAKGRSGYANARTGNTADAAQAMTAGDWRRWLLTNAGEGHQGYEAGKRGYAAHVDGPCADYEDFCRELARRCGV